MCGGIGNTGDVEQQCLVAFAGKETTVTEMSFNLSMSFKGFTAAEYIADPFAQNTTANAISSTMKNVKRGDVTFMSASDVGSADETSRLLQTYSARTRVVFEVRVNIEVLGFRSTDSDIAYSSLTSAFISSVNVGLVIKQLQRTGLSIFGTQLFQNETVVTLAASADPYSVVYVQTASPTFSPTSSPTEWNQLFSVSQFQAFSIVATLGFLFLLCCVGSLWWYRNRRNKKYYPSQVAVEEISDAAHFIFDEKLYPEEFMEQTTLADDLAVHSPIDFQLEHSSDFIETNKDMSDAPLHQKPIFDVSAPGSWDDKSFVSSKILLPPIAHKVQVPAVEMSIAATKFRRMRRKNRVASDEAAAVENAALNITFRGGPGHTGYAEPAIGAAHPSAQERKRGLPPVRVPPGGGYISDPPSGNAYVIESSEEEKDESAILHAGGNRISPGISRPSELYHVLRNGPSRGALSDAPTGEDTMDRRLAHRQSSRSRNGPAIAPGVTQLGFQNNDDGLDPNEDLIVPLSPIKQVSFARRRPGSARAPGPGESTAAHSLNESTLLQQKPGHGIEDRPGGARGRVDTSDSRAGPGVSRFHFPLVTVKKLHVPSRDSPGRDQLEGIAEQAQSRERLDHLERVAELKRFHETEARSLAERQNFEHRAQQEALRLRLKQKHGR